MHSQYIIERCISGVPAGEQRKLVTDHRGIIVQLENGLTLRHLAYIELKKDGAEPRGNHYHPNKTERLFLLFGQVKVVFEDMVTKEQEWILMTRGDLLIINSYVPHCYIALEDSHLIEYSEVPYRTEDSVEYLIKL